MAITPSSPTMNDLEYNSYLMYSGGTSTNASSGNVANAAAVATIPAVAGVTAYLTAFEVTSSGATAATVVTITVTGIQGGTLSYTYTCNAGVTTGNTPLLVDLPTPVAASGQNVAITITLPALGAGNTNATVVAHGFYR